MCKFSACKLTSYLPLAWNFRRFYDILVLYLGELTFLGLSTSAREPGCTISELSFWDSRSNTRRIRQFTAAFNAARYCHYAVLFYPYTWAIKAREKYRKRETKATRLLLSNKFTMREQTSPRHLVSKDAIQYISGLN